jgi:exopolyphosphatase/guanosine-5'-triphosphate,3'-diphosphate pyrophosphatase
MTRDETGPATAEERNDGDFETKAVIDIGSNSIKLRVVRREEDALCLLIDKTELVRMGRGLDSGAIDESAMRHGVDAVQRMTRAAEEMGAKPRLVGTMVLRAARNAEDFIRRVLERTGMTVEVLSEEKEARLAWLGAVHSLGVKESGVAVLDIGGGSTQLIVSRDCRITRSRSFPIGTVSLSEKFFADDPVEPDSVEAAIQAARDAFASGGLSAAPGSSVIGLGGGVLALASVKRKFPSFIPGRLNGTLVTRADVAAQRRLYASMPLTERMKIKGLPPKRADIALAGACIVQCALDALRANSFRVSINGLRYGLLMEMFGLAVGDSVPPPPRSALEA